MAQDDVTPAHLGRTTQVWDAVVFDEVSTRTLALFRCPLVVLYPRPPTLDTLRTFV